MKQSALRIIVLNKKTFHDYYIEQRLEAGLVLESWEIKSIRAGHIQLRNSYVIFKSREAWLIGVHCSPPSNITYHVKPDPKRSRKLLLNKHEIDRLLSTVQKKRLTVVPLDLHWYKNHVKTEVALVRGKRMHDKRETIKRREWERKKHETLILVS
ncbi:SsrA-binding protein SmpB [Coxiella-like endosymbiont of Amblyomma americanum]|uniref:SsrA-binding protein SmpB n=1 Tax=Coxiella-like endosymbiont of Amblyomma americanum TaxID=1987500 RepID=UPI000F89E414|nr:SsrA-binding protein SmpB [Coxiella-like endosymbiont of Amblyomma americanum]AUJ58840.1 SsrA-binding protein [Coxiella-like endosymbiont of Amblyomma americanum]